MARCVKVSQYSNSNRSVSLPKGQNFAPCVVLSTWKEKNSDSDSDSGREAVFNNKKGLKLDSEFKLKMQAESIATLKKIKAILNQTRFNVGTQNSKKLTKSLLGNDKYELAKTTLLNPDVHAAHVEALTAQLLSKWEAIKASKQSEWAALSPEIEVSIPKPTEPFIRSNSLRFLTLSAP